MRMHVAERTNRTHVLAVDAVLAEDVSGRVAFEPATTDREVVTPACADVNSGIAEINAMARRAARHPRRQRQAAFYRRRIAEELPHHAGQPEGRLSKDGYVLAGETLRLHLYPVHFEQRVADLMEKARRGHGSTKA